MLKVYKKILLLITSRFCIEKTVTILVTELRTNAGDKNNAPGAKNIMALELLSSHSEKLSFPLNVTFL